MLPYNDAFSLSLLFHWNSEPWGNVAAYNDPHARMEFKKVQAAGPVVALAESGTSSVGELSATRWSCREFMPVPLAFRDLAAVLDAAYGMTRVRKWPNGGCTVGRPVPSAGGLYPLELYVVCNRVTDVPQGVYHLHAFERTLEPLGMPLSIADRVPDLMNQAFLEPASALIFFTAVFPRTLKKYGARGYRYVLIEAGHAAQNICLQAADLGLATLCVGGFTDHRINKVLKLDGGSEGAVYAVALGHSRPEGGEPHVVNK
jgi:SagB-type dehydrogenase family enzyme